MGDPASEVGNIIFNPVNSFPNDRMVLTLIERRLTLLAENLPFDLQRIQAWVFCKTMLSAACDQDLRLVARAFDQGKNIPTMKGDYFESLDVVRSVLTDKRLDLWRTIRDQRPASISALAEMVSRNFRAVHRDIKLLETLGLVSLKKPKGDRGDVQHPVSLVDELLLAVA